jgi:hypothetical protein
MSSAGTPDPEGGPAWPFEPCCCRLRGYPGWPRLPDWSSWLPSSTGSSSCALSILAAGGSGWHFAVADSRGRTIRAWPVRFSRRRCGRIGGWGSPLPPTSARGQQRQIDECGGQRPGAAGARGSRRCALGPEIRRHGRGDGDRQRRRRRPRRRRLGLCGWGGRRCSCGGLRGTEAEPQRLRGERASTHSDARARSAADPIMKAIMIRFELNASS